MDYRQGANIGWQRRYLGHAGLLVVSAIFLMLGPIAATDPANSAPRRESVAALKARSLLSRRFQDHETRRFLLMSDAGSQWTQVQGQHLERTYHQFLRFARRLGMEPKPLRHKLVCVLFRSRDDYQRFALRYDGVENIRIAGYYAPQTDRIVFYHVDSNPSVSDARIHLAEIEAKMDEVTAQIDAANRRGDPRLAERLSQALREYKMQTLSEQQRIDHFAERVAIATAVHEAFHQLMFHTGLQSRDVVYPLWVSEGLAASFETSTPNQAFGPDHEYGPRREVCTELLASGTYLPLNEFITVTSMVHAEDHSTNVIYHQAYSLVMWMFRYRRAELSAYLESMLNEPPGAPTAARHRALFEQAFGDVRTLERKWLGHERDEMRRMALEALELAEADQEIATVVDGERE